MPITPENAFKEKSTKLLILLLLRTSYNRTFQCETPCMRSIISVLHFLLLLRIFLPPPKSTHNSQKNIPFPVFFSYIEKNTFIRSYIHAYQGPNRVFRQKNIFIHLGSSSIISICKYEECEYDVLRLVDNRIKSNHCLPQNNEKNFSWPVLKL